MSVCALTKAPWRFPLCRLIAWAALSLVAAPGHAVTFVVNTAAGQAGGGIRNLGTLSLSNVTLAANSSGINGGGLLNLGTLTLTNTTVSGNTAGTDGGGIYNSGGGTLITTASTLSGNSANSAGRNGGGIFNASAATLTNVTVSGNSANSGGGGVFNSGGTATLLNVTLGENSAPIGGGISNPAGTVTLTNTLVANSTGGNCSGAISSGGNNLDSGSSCAFAGAGDLSNRDPRGRRERRHHAAGDGGHRAKGEQYRDRQPERARHEPRRQYGDR